MGKLRLSTEHFNVVKKKSPPRQHRLGTGKMQVPRLRGYAAALEMTPKEWVLTNTPALLRAPHTFAILECMGVQCSMMKASEDG